MSTEESKTGIVKTVKKTTIEETTYKIDGKFIEALIRKTCGMPEDAKLSFVFVDESGDCGGGEMGWENLVKIDVDIDERIKGVPHTTHVEPAKS